MCYRTIDIISFSQSVRCEFRTFSISISIHVLAHWVTCITSSYSSLMQIGKQISNGFLLKGQVKPMLIKWNNLLQAHVFVNHGERRWAISVVLSHTQTIERKVRPCTMTQSMKMCFNYLITSNYIYMLHDIMYMVAVPFDYFRGEIGSSAGILCAEK